MAKIEIEPVLLNWIKNQNASGGTPTPAPAPSFYIENCFELFRNNVRIDIVNDLLKFCRPTNVKYMFALSTFELTTVIDMSHFNNINNANNMFSNTTLSNDSLYNVVESFKTIPETLNPRC